jgi:hypothetical protein
VTGNGDGAPCQGFWDFRFTAFIGQGAARVEGAARRWIYGRRDFTGQFDPISGSAWIRYRRCRQQGAGIGMLWIGKYLFAGAGFDRMAQIHHHHVICDMFHDRQIVGDEQIGQLEFFLQVIQQVQDLRLD